MNRYSCKVIQDLLPLYIDDCCSSESRQIVATHVEECLDCRQALIEMRQPFSPAPFPEENAPARILKRGMRKLRKIFLTSLCIAMAVLIVAVMIVSVKGIAGWIGYETLELDFQSNCYFVEENAIVGQSTFSIIGIGKNKRNSDELEYFHGYAEVAAYPIPMEVGAGWFSCGASGNLVTVTNQVLSLVEPETEVTYIIRFLRSDPSICHIMISLEDGSILSAICGENEAEALENYETFWDSFLN